VSGRFVSFRFGFALLFRFWFGFVGFGCFCGRFGRSGCRFSVRSGGRFGFFGFALFVVGFVGFYWFGRLVFGLSFRAFFVFLVSFLVVCFLMFKVDLIRLFHTFLACML